ncbi:hypothetical protein FE257_005391 [Aspergillus nanangensis]|uniref:Heterokaryon incompatibility domain-containing protein n=1 Tax=Aspergillus nanangensis TaxID=2582783 RepID=A0AAD4CQH4_ASPNN|nr:hypothetical protein FE257_005391 [Aspergillus nanangensis]
MTDFNGGRKPDDYPVLSSPFQSMNVEYDVVVIGSGYGAGVAASRMARAGKSVAILELGWERRRLGGCSLINAGVFLEADEETLRMNCWPEDIRNNQPSLKQYYRRAAHMLQPSTYPDTHPSLSKTAHLKNQFDALGEGGTFYKAPLTIFFEERENNVGVTMRENLRSGHECTGLNDGSKNSTPTTYLTDAWNWGATVAAKYSYNGNENINGLSGSSAKPGPTISVVLDHRDKQAKNPLAGYIIQDGCIPEPFSPVIQLMLMGQTLRNTISSTLYPRHFLRATISSLKSLLMGPYCDGGAIQRTATYLVMSHDTNEITLGLEGDNKPFLRGPAESHTDHAVGLRAALVRIIERAGAKVGYSYFFGSTCQEEVTVHLLGDANMSRNGMGSDGVNPLATITALAERSVDLLSQKYGFIIDTETPNGSLNGGSQARISNFSTHSSTIKEATMANIPIGWQFSEVLRGNVWLTPEDMNYATSKNTGKNGGKIAWPIQMNLTMELRRSSINSSEGPRYRGLCTGSVSCTALSHHTMRIMNGALDLFIPSKVHVNGKSMAYTLNILSQEGVEYTITGFKEITSDVSFSISKMWKATTTVYLTIDNGERTIGTGVAHISFSSFQKQLRSMQPISEFNFGLLLSLLLFLVFFTLQLSIFFFQPFVPSRFSRSTTRRQTRTRQCVPSEVLKFKAVDGVDVLLEFYEPRRMVNGHDASHDSGLQPILFVPGITGLQPEHSIFTLPFQQPNMMEYFSNHGCPCYVLTPRWGCDAADAEKCTVYDVQLDIAAALDRISHRESKKPYVIAHCQGSVALAIGLLEGSISSSKIQGMTANSVFMNQAFGHWNAMKASSPILIRAYEYLGGNYFPIADDRINANGKAISRGTWFQRALDVVLHLYPVSSTAEICSSPTCRRTSFDLGQLWNHKNLDQKTHDNIGKFFKGTHTKLLEHVTQMGNAAQCLDEELCPLITKTNLDNLKDLPILFISGSENKVFKPESTLRDYEMLRRRFPATDGIYRRFLAEGYGHLDPIVGKNAAKDVSTSTSAVHLDDLIRIDPPDLCSICYNLDPGQVPQYPVNTPETAEVHKIADTRADAAQINIKNSEQLVTAANQGCFYCGLITKALGVLRPSWNDERSFATIDIVTGRPVVVRVQFGSMSTMTTDGAELRDVGLLLPQADGMEYMMSVGYCQEDIEFELYRPQEPECLRTLGETLLDSLVPHMGFAREISLNPGSVQSFDFIKQTVARCVNEHTCGRGGPEPLLPDRVIWIRADVPSGIKLVEPRNLRAPYIALSYCWGPTCPQTFMTTAETLAERKAGIQLFDLPRLIQDVVFIGFFLGIEYIWVDRLCVLQGDNNDFSHQAHKMEEIFGAATFTLSAASAGNENDRILVPRDGKWSTFDLDTNFQGIVTLRLQLRRRPNASGTQSIGGPPYGRMSSRGWIWQERLLAARTIFFTPGALAFECHCYSKWEGYDDDRTDYSGKRFTRLSDRLPAISGVINRIQHDMGWSPMSGLWESSLLPDLTWEARQTERLGKYACHAIPNAHVPTWSWASLDGPVSYESVNPSTLLSESEPIQWDLQYLRLNRESGRLTLISRLLVAELHFIREGNADIPMEEAQAYFKYEIRGERETSGYIVKTDGPLKPFRGHIDGEYEDTVARVSYGETPPQQSWKSSCACILLGTRKSGFLMLVLGRSL